MQWADFAAYGAGLGMLLALIHYVRKLNVTDVTVKTVSCTFTYVRHTPHGRAGATAAVEKREENHERAAGSP